MKIKFIITVQGTVTDAESATVLNLQGQDYQTVDTTANESKALNEVIAGLEDSYTHICILSAGSTISQNFFTHAETYTEENAVMVPITEWSEKDAEGKDQFRAFLSSFVWSSAFADEVGLFTLKLLLQQIDNTLYGTLIPLAIAKKYKFKESFQYYNHNEYLCRLADNGVDIIGIPKWMANLKMDYQYTTIDNETKTKYFKAVQEQYKTADEVAIA